jgi:ABC-type phosphate transport system auxiliary subunit
MMPVAVRLSKNFYARFGDEATNELIGVINDVAQSQDSTLKDAFAQQIAVFDAKLEHTVAIFDAKLEQRLAQTVAQMDAKMEARFKAERLDARFAAVDVQFAQLRSEMQGLQTTLIRWMFLFFIGSALTVIGFR